MKVEPNDIPPMEFLYAALKAVDNDKAFRVQEEDGITTITIRVKTAAVGALIEYVDDE